MIKLKNVVMCGCDLYIDTDDMAKAKIAEDFLHNFSQDYARVYHSPPVSTLKRGMGTPRTHKESL